MKYIISLVCITIVLYSNSMTPLSKKLKMNRYYNIDTLVPKKAPDSFTLASGKRISMIEVDSIIYRAAKVAMDSARKRGFIDTIKLK